MIPAFFLDRDGVINVEVDYLHKADDVVLIPGTAEAIRLIRNAGYAVVVVSNQSGIARGMFTMDEVRVVEQRINELLGQGSEPDAWYYCPHHPSKGTVKEFVMDCDCRKPKPGLLLRAAEEMNLDLSRSFMIGDKLSDVTAGVSAGCRSCVFVMTGHGEEEIEQAKAGGYAVMPDLLAAVKYLLSK